ncbi:hypothetical protein DSM43518_03021 [Mycobacterium marinum]|uniref:Uncharacterized protein n=1 Tax=Mycobacterium shottsii TaxID=133549 RepID=A0A7I7LH58_9MYCO|nr:MULTISPECIES: hypothetical protein [Mycobacterium ulcerans group]AXN44811.1 hypothetical protein MM1218R_02875 [Mycobacterium marinum]AXN50189.1 hypothetical protein CCUG20998_02784 [Mycobacterium marinum]EPQ80525.1 hypothetical protein MMEU_1050 [Mycobacterium marinum str. Europe]QYL28826.1 hypothetical protein TM48_03209 [Mycobacterium shottsii]RFZ04164.1 hypothetical protein DE4381_04319 [Mycobacterium marinum]
MTILQETAQSAVSKVIIEALESATATSVISALAEGRNTASKNTFRPSIITLETIDGQEIRVSTLTSKSATAAELVSAGTTIDAAPTGTYVLACGKTLVIENGRLVGGTAAAGDIPDWAVFYLLPVDRQRCQ